jgi:hypothetical protein
MTYALGYAFCVYLNGKKRGALPTQEVLNQAYQEAFSHARNSLNQN